MEILEIVAKVIGVAADGVTGKDNKKLDKYFYIILLLVVIGLFLFTFLMS